MPFPRPQEPPEERDSINPAGGDGLNSGLLIEADNNIPVVYVDALIGGENIQIVLPYARESGNDNSSVVLDTIETDHVLLVHQDATEENNYVPVVLLDVQEEQYYLPILLLEVQEEDFYVSNHMGGDGLNNRLHFEEEDGMQMVLVQAVIEGDTIQIVPYGRGLSDDNSSVVPDAIQTAHNLMVHQDVIEDHDYVHSYQEQYCYVPIIVQDVQEENCCTSSVLCDDGANDNSPIGVIDDEDEGEFREDFGQGLPLLTYPVLPVVLQQSSMMPPAATFQARESPDQQLQQDLLPVLSGLSSPTKRKHDESCVTQESKRQKLDLDEHPEETILSTQGLCSVKSQGLYKTSEDLTPSTSSPSSSTKRKSDECCDHQVSKRWRSDLGHSPEDATTSMSGLSSITSSGENGDCGNAGELTASTSGFRSAAKRKRDKSCEPQAIKRLRLDLEDVTLSTSGLSCVMFNSQNEDSGDQGLSTSAANSLGNSGEDEDFVEPAPPTSGTSI